MTTSAAKYTGCLLGGAIGDALGMPFAGSPADATGTTGEIEARTDAGITAGMESKGVLAESETESGVSEDFLPGREIAPLTIPLAEMGEPERGEILQAGQWTDDTQLTLALAETLLEERGQFVPEAWAHALVRWLNDAPRGPEPTTLQAALQLRTGAAWDEVSEPDEAGCGPAARVAPIALAFPDPALRRNFARLQAQVTHGHPDAQAGAFVVAEAIALALPVTPDALADWSGPAFLETLAERTRAESPDFEAFARVLDLALALLTDGVATETALRVLGGSAWAREAVPCALYCVASHPQNLETILLTAGRRTGANGDSIGAMAGAIGGALHGASGLPLRWRLGVEQAERIESVARDLFALSRMQSAGATP